MNEIELVAIFCIKRIRKISKLNLEHQKENTYSLLIIISSFLGSTFLIYLYFFHKNNANKLKNTNNLIENQSQYQRLEKLFHST